MARACEILLIRPELPVMKAASNGVPTASGSMYRPWNEDPKVFAFKASKATGMARVPAISAASRHRPSHVPRPKAVMSRKPSAITQTARISSGGLVS